MIRRSQRLDKGFTLVELLLVITILGILASIVVFAVGTTGASAAAVRCQSDVRTVETALEVSKARLTTYDAPIANLVGDGYLRDTPSDSHYTIDVSSSGAVFVTPDGGPTVTIATGSAITPAIACTGVK